MSRRAFMGIASLVPFAMPVSLVVGAHRVTIEQEAALVTIPESLKHWVRR